MVLKENQTTKNTEPTVQRSSL